MPHHRALPPRTGAWMLVVLLAACLLALPVAGAAAAAGTSQPAALAVSASWQRALAVRNTAERAVAGRRRALERCLHRHPGHCRRARRALKRAELRRARASKHLNGIARASRSNASKLAPTITVSGETLSWNAVANVSSYVLVRKVPGQEDQYSVLHSTSVTPPAVPGATVRYAVRTNVKGSAWSAEVSISYPSEPALTTSSGSGSEATSTSSSGSESTSSSSSGSVEGTLSSSSTTSGPFEMGVVAGSALTYELPFIEKLGAHTARMEFSIGTPPSQLAPVMEEYARAGIRPLLLASFDGTLPSSSEARNLASWAAEYGPNGNFWKGKSFPTGTAVTDIEFGNETSYSYQYSDNSSSAYAARAQTYALRLREAYEAVHSANPGVGLLAQADDGDSSSSAWVQNMFLAVPNLGQIVSGWTIHPYGPEWATRIDRLISQTNAVGAPASVPIYVTEWGLASDNGRCLSDNYGWNACMSYSEAASVLGSVVGGMRARYGSRLAAFYLYQAHDQDATGASSEREGYFGALQSNQAPKGEYTTTVQSLLSANP
jgi:hypothetical protein